MTTTAVADDRPLPSVGRGRFLVLPGLILAADWLFYGHAIGVSTVVFLAILAAAVLVAGPARTTPRALVAAGLVLLAAAVQLAYAATVSAMVLAAFAAAHFALTAAGQGAGALWDRIVQAGATLVDGCGRVVVDLAAGRAKDAPPAPGRRTLRPGALAAWIVPVGLGGLFLLLFRSANPLIEDWLDAIDPGDWVGAVTGRRVLFWLGAFALLWPLVRVARPLSARLFGQAVQDVRAGLTAAAPGAGWREAAFGKIAILRSLVLFNLMFAVQTGLDLAYLWGGLALPEGMSYAAYAHRGAYPLVATALLAAVFVLAAMRPGSESARSPAIRALVFLWVAQNVLLVVSSALRLDLYVAVYALTYLRVAAFVWMLLVAVGLVLIVLRIALGRSNRWLLSANATALLLTLYACGFVNVPAVIASYNVDHSRELTGEGVALDFAYLAELGPQAIPALDRFIAAGPADRIDEAIALRARLAEQQADTMAGWRAWTVRGAYLAGYLSDAEPYVDSWAGPVEP